MSSEEKKAYLLLLSVIFHYHGLDEDEKQSLNRTADQLNATSELQWANEFISKDYISAFERSREYFLSIMPEISEDTRIKYLGDVWKANLQKGYITEMEAMALLTLAKDWDVEAELIKRIRS